jgi:genome maintenance exonuclease 1
VGVWQGQPAILDFKQTNKPKKREWIEDYFLQLAAYSQAHNHMCGTDIKSGVILMCAQHKKTSSGSFSTPEYQEFVVDGSEFQHYVDQWSRRVEQYYQLCQVTV